MNRGNPKEDEMNEYLISGKVTTTCQAGERVKEMIESGTSSFKSILSPDRKLGGYPLYIDEITDDWTNVYAVVKSIKEGKTELDDFSFLK